jgi:hypothetical protein
VAASSVAADRTVIAAFDTTDLVGPGADAADILLVAGFSLPRERVPDLLRSARATKRRLCNHETVPVKWNLRGQPRALNLHGYGALQDLLIEISNELRSALLQCLREAQPSIFLSILHAHSFRRQVLIDLCEDLTRFAFANLLMRLGLSRAAAADTRQTEVSLDWPEGNAPSPFIAEYLSGWREGVSPNGLRVVPYRCGPLRDFGFLPSPVFGVADVDERLQLADLCVAASRAFVNCAIGRAAGTDYATEEFRKLIPCLYAPAGMVMGRGVTVAPANQDLSRQVCVA